jgi:hypothetical protein
VTYDSAVEQFQVTMKDKEQYIAIHIPNKISLSRNAASTSLVESMNSHIKVTMGCSSNMITSNSLLKMARGSDQRISMFDKDSHRELQFTSLSSTLKIKDKLIHECLHICNQNFDKQNFFIVCNVPKTVGWYGISTTIYLQSMTILN